VPTHLNSVRGFLILIPLLLAVSTAVAFPVGPYREKPNNARGHFQDAVGMVDRGSSLPEITDYLRYGEGPMRSALTVERDREAVRAFYLARARGGDWSDEWFDLDFVRNSFLNASRELRAGAPLQAVLVSVGLTSKHEVFQVLNNENFREAVATFLGLWADQRQIEANALYEELLEPSYHFKWFAHTIHQGTPLREATNHFKYLSPLMHQALTKEADREAVYHYARVRAGEQTDPGAFFRLKVVQDAFEHALHAIEQGEALLLALEYLMEGEGTWRSTVLSNERERNRVKKYVLACLRADVELEARYWHELIYFWAARQVANDGDLEVIAAQVRIAPAASPFFRALTQAADRRAIRAFYRAFALRKFRSNREFFELAAVKTACKGAAALIGAGEPVDVAVSQTGIDSRFSLYPILVSEENREDAKSFMHAIFKEEGFDKALDHLSYALDWLRSVELESGEEPEPDSPPKRHSRPSLHVSIEESTQEVLHEEQVEVPKMDLAPQITASMNVAKPKSPKLEPVPESKPESLRELLTTARKTLAKVRETRTQKKDRIASPAPIEIVNLKNSPFTDVKRTRVPKKITSRSSISKVKPILKPSKKEGDSPSWLKKQNEKAFEDFTRKLQSPPKKKTSSPKLKTKVSEDRVKLESPSVEVKAEKRWNRGSRMAADLFGPSIATSAKPKIERDHKSQLNREEDRPKTEKSYRLYKNTGEGGSKKAKTYRLYKKGASNKLGSHFSKEPGPFQAEMSQESGLDVKLPSGEHSTQVSPQPKKGMGRQLRERFRGLMQKLRGKRKKRRHQRVVQSVAPQKSSSPAFALDSLPPPPPTRMWREGFMGSNSPARSLLRSTLIQVDRARDFIK
jgi:hypothetical protein